MPFKQQETQTYFHIAPIKVAVGTIIQPGNFGRIIRSHYPTNNTNNLVAPYREAVFEYARLALAPSKPSRLDCLFACFTLADAQAYRAANSPTGLIYEIEPNVGVGDAHIADWQLISFPTTGQFSDIFEMARQYWTGGNPAQNREILLPRAAKVVAFHG